MQPNIVWNQVASRKGLQANGLDTCWKYIQTRHLEMSKSFPAMVETAVSKVSINFTSGATFPVQWCDLPRVGATFPVQWCDLPRGGATFPVQWCDHPRSLIFISLTSLIGPKKVLQGKNYLYACLVCKAFRELRHYDKVNQCCLRPC
jgi:hypothetical protein